MVLCNCLLQCGSTGSKMNVGRGEIHMLADWPGWPLFSVEGFPVSRKWLMWFRWTLHFATPPKRKVADFFETVLDDNDVACVNFNMSSTRDNGWTWSRDGRLEEDFGCHDQKLFNSIGISQKTGNLLTWPSRMGSRGLICMRMRSTVMLISIGRPRRCRHHNLNSHYLQPCGGLHQHHQKRSRIGLI